MCRSLTGNKILNCLSDKIPFWDRQIDMGVSTNPQQNDIEGLISVLSTYRVKNIVETGLGYKTPVNDVWQKKVKNASANIIKPITGQKYVFGKSDLVILWPSSQVYNDWQNAPSDLKDYSVVSRFEYGNFCVYLTGGAPKETIGDVVNKKCSVVQILQHGAKAGTDNKLLSEADPKIAAIQVGTKNNFRLPSADVLELLASKKVKIMRVNESGTFEIRSNGEDVGVVKN